MQKMKVFRRLTVLLLIVCLLANGNSCIFYTDAFKIFKITDIAEA